MPDDKEKRIQSSFPKPERGVPRYELMLWGGDGWLCERVDSNKACLSAFMLRRTRDVLWFEAPMYIFDRRTGQVVATNEEALNGAK